MSYLVECLEKVNDAPGVRQWRERMQNKRLRPCLKEAGRIAMNEQTCCRVLDENDDELAQYAYLSPGMTELLTPVIKNP